MLILKRILYRNLRQVAGAKLRMLKQTKKKTVKITGAVAGANLHQLHLQKLVKNHFKN